ncbi:hypothetical protein WA158_000206 [Blastocystis sp. Blastoise]
MNKSTETIQEDEQNKSVISESNSESGTSSKQDTSVNSKTEKLPTEHKKRRAKASYCPKCNHELKRYNDEKHKNEEIIDYKQVKNRCHLKRPVTMNELESLVDDIYYSNNIVPYFEKDTEQYHNNKSTFPSNNIYERPLSSPIADWTPYEFAVFESTISVIGKDFHTIASLLPFKTTAQVIDLFYYWKHTNHYKIWKKNYDPEVIIKP